MEEMDLTAFFQTKSGALDFSSRLAVIADGVYKSDFNLERTFQKEFGIEKKEAFLKLLGDNNISTDAIPQLKEFLVRMQEKIKILPVLSLTIAFEPGEQTLRSVAEWFVVNLKKQVLLDITVDPQLIAGAAISYNGQFMDASLKSPLKKIIEEGLRWKETTKPIEETTVHPDQTTQSADHFSLPR